MLMNNKLELARIVIDVEKTTHKQLKMLAVDEERSLRALMLEAIDLLLAKKTNIKNRER
jgi:hypothetical protein